MFLPVFFVPKVEAISIASWNNTKTNNQDSIFVANQGDSITFSISTDIDPGQYIWTVNQVQQATTTSSFIWTVPSQLSTWNISVQVKEYNLPAIGTDLTKFAFKDWSVTTI